VKICPECKAPIEDDGEGHVDGCRIAEEDLDVLIHTGWRCPLCLRIFNPFIQECKYCNSSLENE